jgi:PncC family amidohydrolase
MTELLELAAAVGRRAIETGRTIATAESCTGGLVGHLLTEIPGSSTWYVGGAVVYSDALKQRLAGVPAERIAGFGAVSAEVATDLATGARQRFGADLGLAVTGIAGPTGATPTKPVGLVFVAVADADGVVVRRFIWDGDRSANKRASAGAVLRLVLERLGVAASGEGGGPSTSAQGGGPDPDAEAAPR